MRTHRSSVAAGTFAQKETPPVWRGAERFGLCHHFVVEPVHRPRFVQQPDWRLALLLRRGTFDVPRFREQLFNQLLMLGPVRADLALKNALAIDE